MRIVECLAPMLGSWQGVNRLRVMPTDDYRDSDATATVSVTAREFVTIAYTWVEEGKPQDGLMLLSGTSDEVKAIFADSWHSAPTWMTFSGTADEDGVVRLTGSYPAGSGPDWGWLIHIEPAKARITMHNVVPGHDAYQCVETTYDRQA